MRRKKLNTKTLVAENRALQERLQNVEETLRAVQRGEVDGIVISTSEGEQLFTLSGVEKPYRLLIEEMKEGAVMLSDNNTILYSNIGFAEIIKQPLDKIIGTNIQKIITPTHNSVFEELMRSGRKGEGSKVGEVSLQTANKTTVPVHMSVNSFQKDDVKTTFLVFTDLTRHMQEDVKRYTAGLELEISKRERVEQALRQAEERFRIALKNAPVSVAAQDLERKYIWAYNQKTANPEEIIGKTDRDIFKPQEADHIVKIKERVIREGVDIREQMWLDRPSGKIYLDITWSPLRDSNRKIIGVTSATVDLTELKRAEEALKESETKFKTLAENSPDAIMRFDKDLRILYLNPQDLAATGKTLDEFVGKTNEEMGMPAELCKLWNGMFERAKAEKQVQQAEFDFNTPTGIRTFNLRIVPEFAEDGSLISFIGISHDITERKKAEKEIASLARFALENPAVVLRINREGVVLFANPVAQRFLNHWQTKVGERAPDHVWKMVVDSLASNDKTEFEENIEEETYAFLVAPIASEDYANLYGRGITKRKKAEEASKEIQCDLNRAQAVGKIGSWRLDTQHNVLLWSDENHRIFGVPKGTPMTYETFLGTVHPDDREYIDEKWKAGLRGEPYDIEHRIIVDGEVKWVRERAELEFDKDGTLLGGFGTTQDITERTKAEEALRESEHLYRSIFENSQDGFQLVELIYDKGHVVDFRFLRVNSAYESQTGVKADFVVGKTARQFDPNIERHWLDMYEEVDQTGVARHMTDYNQNIDRWIDVYTYSFADGKVGSLFRNVTDQKRMEKQLKDSERLAAIGATAGMVGHDIRNPLQSITGDIYLARADVALLPESEEKTSLNESLSSIENNVQYINKIVSDLQDFAKPLNPCVEETNLKTVVAGLLVSNGLPKNIKPQVKIDENVAKVTADSAFIKRIMGNLVSNAVQAMPNGGTLSIEVFKDSDDTVIMVEDSGVGIPEAVRAKLFTPLFTTKSKGQGFGLAVVKRMTEALGGAVTFESEVGKGTKFIVRLPPPQRGKG